MAIMETKIVQVRNDPQTINETNEAWGRFGWSVLSVQVTHSQDTKTYSGIFDTPGNYTVETTTINYATITYQRDKEMKDYTRIIELESEYWQLLSRGAPKEPVPTAGLKRRYLVIGILGSFVIGAGVGSNDVLQGILLAVIVGYFGFNWWSRKAIQADVERIEAENENKCKKHQAKLKAIQAEAESLL